MDFTEIELSGGILRTSRNASVSTIIASGITLVSFPKIGLITYMGYGVLILFIGHIFTSLIKECLNVKKYNQNAENINIKIKQLRSMIDSLKDENLKEKRNFNISCSVLMLIISILFAMTSIKGNQPLMGFSSSTFLLSSLAYAKTGSLYQQLMDEVGIEEKTLIKKANLKRGPEF